MGIELIAEVGSVHDGSFGNACKLIELATQCGADVVKFQTHIAEAETLKDAPLPPYFTGEPRAAYFHRTAFTKAQWKQLMQHARDQNIGFLSSPFSLQAVDLLAEIGVEAYKIPSGEVTNIPLLEKITATGKRSILSSGMSNWAELDTAVKILAKGGPLCVLQCSSLYPCPPERAGLNLIPEIRKRYGVEVGFSDHTRTNTASIAAAALGASVIEKHLTFSRSMYGSDAANASEPGEFSALAAALQEMSILLTSGIDKNDLSPYLEMKRIFEKSVVAARPLKAGTTLSESDIAFKKPGDGIAAANYRAIIGRRLTVDVASDHKFSEADFV
jgi:N,N'-diacetyllegionaminate synthase